MTSFKNLVIGGIRVIPKSDPKLLRELFTRILFCQFLNHTALTRYYLGMQIGKLDEPLGGSSRFPILILNLYSAKLY